ncbi:MAG: hypothetical protein A6D91_09535 [Bacillaceae bacterium G1]|nr:hypothetical protein [Bacillota bacterium]OJF18216.1 MAG: hypothetical protein A6D91_09535 [Bacillaceae bacterium G1]
MRTFLQASWAVAAKDLRIQFRQKSLILSMVVFALLIHVLLHFSFQANPSAMQQMAAGLLWLPIFLSTLLGIGRLTAIEEPEDNWEGLWLAPVDPGAVFLGKMWGSLFVVLFVEVVSVPLFFILYNPPAPQSLSLLFVCLLLGTWGYVSLATFFSVMARASRLGDLLLPILLFPISIPLLLAVVRLSQMALFPAMPGQEWLWLAVLGAYDILFTLLPVLTFEYLLEV